MDIELGTTELSAHYFMLYLIREIMPECSDTEWRVICTIFDKTYGWRKTRDWISANQFKKLTARGRTALSAVFESLFRKGVILITSNDHKPLATPSIRKLYGRTRRKMYFCFNPDLVQKANKHFSDRRNSTIAVSGQNKSNVLQRKTFTTSIGDSKKTFKRELTEAEQDLTDKITEWLTRPLFNTRLSEEAVQLQVENCIRKYGYAEIEDIYEYTANQAYDPHPREFWNEIKALKELNKEDENE